MKKNGKEQIHLGCWKILFHKNIKPSKTRKVNCTGDCSLRDYKNLSLIPQLFVMRTHQTLTLWLSSPNPPYIMLDWARLLCVLNKPKFIFLRNGRIGACDWARARPKYAHRITSDARPCIPDVRRVWAVIMPAQVSAPANSSPAFVELPALYWCSSENK